jgi:hypothetical protein
VVHVRISFLKKDSIKLKLGLQGNYILRTVKGINKDDIFFHFKQGRLELMNFDLIQDNDLDMQRIMICECIITKSITCHYAYW